MANAFTEAAALASAAVDSVAGERLRFVPKGKGDNWSSGADQTRAPFECIGTFLDGDADLRFAVGDRNQSDFQSRVAMQAATASVDRANFPPGKEPRKDDVLELLDHTPVRAFTIISVGPMGTSRVMISLAVIRS